MGIIINKKIDYDLYPDLLEQLGIDKPLKNKKLFIRYGGPIESGRGFVLHSDDLIRNEIIRYICIPSQALSYKVGELTILFLRDRYLKKFPDDLKGFHDLVFEVGPCSLDLLVKEFIKKNI